MIGIASFACSCGNQPAQKEATSGPKTDRYPEKGDMVVLADRPPQLETPLYIYKQDITPNNYFFVRWHLAQLLNRINTDTFKLYVRGNVAHPLAISYADLKTKYPQDSIVALAICSGNSRSTFNPRVPGLQWKNGAMGNAKWKGVKLKYLLEAAGIKNDAVDVSFQGMDLPPMPGIEPYVRSLDKAHALDGEVLVAYEMNGEPLPMLNGFPLKLVVPGWYAAYWVSSLNQIEVLNKPFQGYWMKKAYLSPENSAASETPNAIAANRTPLTKVRLHSIFVTPDTSDVLSAGKPFELEGLAFNDGTPIAKVEISTDSAKSWNLATLNPEISKYSWRRWKYTWTPSQKGKYTLVVRATDANGKTQPTTQWNKNGYARDFMEQKNVVVQ